jgi:hypothetical protein
MEIHKPKAAHSFREFLIEIGTIVCGILIALALEQAVEFFHWRHEVEIGREHLREEIAFDLRVYRHRADVANCVASNLKAINSMVSRLRRGERIEPVALIVTPQNGPILSEAWESLKAGQVLVHFPKAELERYAHFYQGRIDAEYFMDRESRSWRSLHLLEGDPNRLTPQDRSTLWVAQGEAAEMSDGVRLISLGQIDVARALGIDLPKADPNWRDECSPPNLLKSN